MTPEGGQTSRRPMRLGIWFGLFVLFVGLAGGIYLWLRREYTRIPVAVPVRHLPAYYQIQSADITEHSLPREALAADTFAEASEMVGRYSLGPLQLSEPVTYAQLGPVVDTSIISNTVAIAIEGGPALSFDGQLRPGAVVEVWSRDELVLARALVLDVRNAIDCRKREAASQYVVVLAVPPDQRAKIVAGALADALSLTQPSMQP